MAASFSIQTAAQRTGLSPHVIRAWERRYAAIEPDRSAGQHRLYSEAEIERLALLHRAVKNGHTISRIARLPVDELRPLALEAGLPPSDAVAAEGDAAASFRADSLSATERFDLAALNGALRDALLELGHHGLLQRVIAATAEAIGERWRAGELTAAHEHFFTAAAKVFIGDLTRQFSTADTAPRIVIGTPLGQVHELGAVMAAATAANLGWNSIYLGPSLPAAEIAGVARRNKAAAVALSVIYPEDDPILIPELTELSTLLPKGTRLLVGGRAAKAYIELLARIGALYAETLNEFGQQLDGLRRAPERK